VVYNCLVMNTPNKITFTKEGFNKISGEYSELLRQRPSAVEDLKKAREMGDLSENGYYKASRAKLSFIDNRLFHLKMLIKQAKIIETPSTNIISFGCNVLLKHGENTSKYKIVSKYEANPSEGKVSDVSPIGKALLGKKVGAIIEIAIPAGVVSYTVVKITI
jgi:transcription elongation factor GreA